MKIKRIFPIFVLLVSALLHAGKVEVRYVELLDGKEIDDQPIQTYDSEISVQTGKRITIYPDIEFQTIEGFGGAFNEIGGDALMSLPEQLQTEVIDALFSKESAAFTFCRTAVGASDFGLDAYSYSEIPDDFEMEHFSVARETTSVLPYISKAIDANADLNVFASPWSPPGWMKYSGFMDRGVEFPEKNHLKDEANIYEAYALYFVNYVQAYAEQGIDVSRLIIQNEPDVHTKYPSCVMPPKQMGMFAEKYLQPAFDKNKIDTEVWAGTFRTAQQLDAIEFVADPALRNSVAGIGIQYTKPRYIQDMLTIVPDVKMMHTEGNCYNGLNSVEQAKNRLQEVANYLNHGVPNYCYWNMILNETGESGWDWKQNSLINIDREKKTVTYNPDFAVMALLGRYIQPGSKRIAGFARTPMISIKKDGKVYLFVQNDDPEPQTYECWIEHEKKFVAEIPANSVSVIILDID